MLIGGCAFAQLPILFSLVKLLFHFLHSQVQASAMRQRLYSCLNGICLLTLIVSEL